MHAHHVLTVHGNLIHAHTQCRINLGTVVQNSEVSSFQGLLILVCIWSRRKCPVFAQIMIMYVFPVHSATSGVALSCYTSC